MLPEYVRPPLLIRADANTQIGTGHIMRCLALAQAWQALGGHAVFLSHTDSETLRSRVEVTGIRFNPLVHPYPDPTDLRRTLQALEDLQAQWLVLDGYHFDPGYQRAVREAGYRLLVIDDTAHWPEYHADILLNQNVNAEKLMYRCDSNSTLLLGTRHVLLRPEFLAWRGWRRQFPDLARKIIVTLGGGDPENVTLKVIQSLQEVRVNGLEVLVVAGPNNPHYAELQSNISRIQFSVRLVSDVPNMPELMAWGDMGVSAGGITCWETAFMGLPNAILVLAENQKGVAQGLDDLGIALNLGWHVEINELALAQALKMLMLNQSRRKEMSEKGQDLVDGDGVDRVLMWMHGEKLRFRRANEKDGQLLWKWRNDPATRAVSFSSELIPWEEHLKWFRSKLNDPHYVFYIAIDQEEIPIGQVRYEVNGDEATISVSLDMNYRNKGYGSEMIGLASEKLFQGSGVKLIHSYVKTCNNISISAFLKAGYRKMGMTKMSGQEAVHLVLPRGGMA